MSLPISDVVDVSISFSAAAPGAPTFDTGRIMCKTVLPYYDRVREYADIDEVLVDFVAGTEVYKAAALYFGQTPSPEVFQVARVFETAQSGVLRGGVVSDDFNDYTGITDGGFDIVINGVLKHIVDMDFSALLTMTAIAAAMQTKLAAAVASTTCTWDADHSRFIITVAGTTGTGSTIAYATAATTGGPSSDESATLGFTVASGARAVNGCAIEDVVAGITAAGIVNPNYFAVGLTSEFDADDIDDASEYCEAAKKKFFFTTSDGNALGTGDTSNIGYVLMNDGRHWSIGMFSSFEPYAAFSLMARELIVDFSQPNSAITDKFKQLPGVPTEDLTSAQVNAVKGYNLNVYVDRGGFSMVEEGVMSDGTFSDEVTGLAWLEGQIQTEVFGVLATARSKIPQTDEGVQKLVQAVDRAFQRAVNAGLLAPGVWNGDDVGAVKSGDTLAKGYYTYAAPVSEQSQASREAREAPPITGVACGAGAIHSANIAVNFQR